jgi:hypothetical protein
LARRQRLPPHRARRRCVRRVREGRRLVHGGEGARRRDGRRSGRAEPAHRVVPRRRDPG